MLQLPAADSVPSCRKSSKQTDAHTPTTRLPVCCGSAPRHKNTILTVVKIHMDSRPNYQFITNTAQTN